MLRGFLAGALASLAWSSAAQAGWERQQTPWPYDGPAPVQIAFQTSNALVFVGCWNGGVEIEIDWPSSAGPRAGGHGVTVETVDSGGQKIERRSIWANRGDLPGARFSALDGESSNLQEVISDMLTADYVEFKRLGGGATGYLALASFKEALGNDVSQCGL